MANYLVTGVAGFIGSSLARALVSAGHKVRGVDNFATGRRENITDILGRIEFIQADILDRLSMHDACAGIDYVLHEAAIPSVPRSVADPYASNQANVDGTLSLLIAARDAKVKRVIYAGSSSAYGDTPVLPKSEDMQPNPISPYAVSKLTGEFYMRSFYLCYGLETVTLRYFNVFGPYQDPNSPYSAVLAKFITQMLAGKRPTIFGDGEQSRDFTYIDNVVDANIRACTAPAEKCVGRVFNAACGRRVSLNDIYRVVQRLCGYDRDALYAPPRAGDIKHSLADITAAADAFRYKPIIDFETGLERTVEWYKNGLQPEIAVKGIPAAAN